MLFFLVHQVEKQFQSRLGLGLSLTISKIYIHRFGTLNPISWTYIIPIDLTHGSKFNIFFSQYAIFSVPLISWNKHFLQYAYKYSWFPVYFFDWYLSSFFSCRVWNGVAQQQLLIGLNASEYWEWGAWWQNMETEQDQTWLISSDKLDGVAPLIAEPPTANSTTMHSWLVCEDQN